MFVPTEDNGCVIYYKEQIFIRVAVKEIFHEQINNLPGVVSFAVTFKKFDWFDAQVNSHKCFTKFDKQDGQRFRKLAANSTFLFKTSIWN